VIANDRTDGVYCPNIQCGFIIKTLAERFPVDGQDESRPGNAGTIMALVATGTILVTCRLFSCFFKKIICKSLIPFIGVSTFYFLLSSLTEQQTHG